MPTIVTNPAIAQPRPKAPTTSPVPAPATGVGARMAGDRFVSANRPQETAPSPAPTFKELAATNRTQLADIQQAKDAAAKDPAALGAWQTKTTAHLDWLESLQGSSTFPLGQNEILKSWLEGAAQSDLEAHPLPNAAARTARFNQLFGEFHARPTLRAQAMLKAATQEVLPRAAIPLEASCATIQAQLGPATAVLAASKSPLAQDLARRIRGGDLSLQMVAGKMMGTEFYAVVTSSTIKLSNGQQGPNFFELSPPYQAATLLHEYTHVKQKQQPSGFLGGMGGNLVQRSLGLASRLAGSNAERLDAMGRGLNGAEQEAYRNEKGLLSEMGLGTEGLNVPDIGMLAGIDDWLSAAKP